MQKKYILLIGLFLFFVVTIILIQSNNSISNTGNSALNSAIHHKAFNESQKEALQVRF